MTQKGNLKALEVAKAEAHKELDYNEYDNTLVEYDTNCATHAYGITTILDEGIRRVGAISREKTRNERYVSKSDLKKCCIADLKELGLQYEEIEFISKPEFLHKVNEMKLSDNQHIIVLFARIFAGREIFDFHFLRYDNQKGWTEKRKHEKPTYIENIDLEWPSLLQWYEFVSAFVITR